jgi:hypothetical protein
MPGAGVPEPSAGDAVAAVGLDRFRGRGEHPRDLGIGMVAEPAGFKDPPPQRGPAVGGHGDQWRFHRQRREGAHGGSTWRAIDGGRDDRHHAHTPAITSRQRSGPSVCDMANTVEGIYSRRARQNGLH